MLINIHKFFICIFYTSLMLYATPIFSNPIKKFDAAFQGLCKKDLSLAEKEFNKEALREGKNRLLALYELGNFYHLSGDFKKSAYYLNLADKVAHDYEDQALISSTKITNNLSAMLGNDSMLRYEGFNYEKVMAHTINAMNYIFMGDMEGARIECRKADEYQRLDAERSIKQVTDANNKSLIADPSSFYDEIASYSTLNNKYTADTYSSMLNYTKNNYKFFDNVFTYFLASQIYLARGTTGLNDAIIDINRAFTLMPETPVIRSAYLDIASACGGAQLEKAKKQLKIANDSNSDNSAAKECGSVIVCYESGIVPKIDQVSVPFFIHNGLYKVSLPIYKDFGTHHSSITIQTNNNEIVTTPILNVGNLAVKTLEKCMPSIIVRNLLGVTAKTKIQEKIEEKGGSLIASLANIASLAATSADHRSWLSLPSEIQVAKFNLNSGQHVLNLFYTDEKYWHFRWTETIPINITQGSYNFILIRSLPGFRKIDVKTLDAKLLTSK